jgi:hypothetical protein
MVSLTRDEFLQRLIERYSLYRLAVLHHIEQNFEAKAKVSVDEKGQSCIDLTELVSQILLPALLAAVNIIFSEENIIGGQ